MKILHVISSGGMYGAEAVILSLLRSMAGGEHRGAVAVFSNTAQPNLDLYERALAEGMEAHLIRCRGQVDTAVPAAIRACVRQAGVDIVHAHGYKADLYVYAALRGRMPLVSTCHTWYDNDLALRLYGAADRLALRGYSRVIAVSEEVRQRLLASGVRAGRVSLVRNGIDVERFSTERRTRRRVGPEGLRVGLVGRLSREKGIDLFVRAAARVLSAVPRTRFLVVGDGPDHEPLQALIEELGVGDKVELCGRVEEMAAFYASLDLLVSASRQEGLPVALLEGMASGLPIVATRAGAVPTVVRDGETGVLVPVEDVEGLAGAIIQLLGDESLRERYGSAAEALVREQFSAERMAAEYLRLYEQACEE